MKYKWYIHSTKNGFWNCNHGFVNRGGAATRYSDKEKESFNLPPCEHARWMPIPNDGVIALTIEEVVRQLMESIGDKSAKDYAKAVRNLYAYASERNWCMSRLNDWCWENEPDAFEVACA